MAKFLPSLFVACCTGRITLFQNHQFLLKHKKASHKKLFLLCGVFLETSKLTQSRLPYSLKFVLACASQKFILNFYNQPTVMRIRRSFKRWFYKDYRRKCFCYYLHWGGILNILDMFISVVAFCFRLLFSFPQLLSVRN